MNYPINVLIFISKLEIYQLNAKIRKVMSFYSFVVLFRECISDMFCGFPTILVSSTFSHGTFKTLIDFHFWSDHKVAAGTTSTSGIVPGGLLSRVKKLNYADKAGQAFLIGLVLVVSCVFVNQLQKYSGHAGVALSMMRVVNEYICYVYFCFLLTKQCWSFTTQRNYVLCSRFPPNR